MFELLALAFALVVLGPVVLLLLGFVVLPIYLVVKAVGFAFKLTFGLVGALLGLAGALLGGLLLLPVALVVGALILLKLLILGLPLLLVGGLIWLLVRGVSRPPLPA